MNIRNRIGQIEQNLFYTRAKRRKTVWKVLGVATLIAIALFYYSKIVPPMEIYAKIFIPFVYMASFAYLGTTIDRSHHAKEFELRYLRAILTFSESEKFKEYHSFFLHAPNQAQSQKKLDSDRFMEFAYLALNRTAFEKPFMQKYKEFFNSLQPPREWLYLNLLFQFQRSMQFQEIKQEYDAIYVHSFDFLEFAYLKTRETLSPEDEAKLASLAPLFP